MREKQKDIRRAKLAIRRMLRSRLGKSQQAAAASLARSNAIIFSRAAASLIRARDGDMQLGWEPSPPTASLLCFDEVQVNDPFSALALKGRLPLQCACSIIHEAVVGSVLLDGQCCF